jgi:hypothetical protein
MQLRLDRATSGNTMLREVARSSRTMTRQGRVNLNADWYQIRRDYDRRSETTRNADRMRSWGSLI